MAVVLVAALLAVTAPGCASIDFRHGPFSLFSDQAGVAVTAPAMARVQLQLTGPGGTEVDARSCIVTIAVDGDVRTTLTNARGFLSVPIGPSIEWTVIASPPAVPGALFAVANDRFTVAGDQVRTMRLQPLGTQSPWQVDEVAIDEKFFELRAAAGGSSRMRIEMQRTQ